MPGKTITPQQLTEAVTLRAAGLTLVAISAKIGISVSTLQRVFEKHRTVKGAVTAEMIDTAKRKLMERVTCDERIREEAARLIADDLGHTALLRNKMALAAEQLKAENLGEAALLMRAAAAYSTALRNTSDVLRHLMRFDKAIPETPVDALPELRLQVISDDNARSMTKAAAISNAS